MSDAPDGPTPKFSAAVVHAITDPDFGRVLA